MFGDQEVDLLNCRTIRVAITKYHRLDRALKKTKHLFLTVLEDGKFKVKVPVDLVSGEGPPPCS